MGTRQIELEAASLRVCSDNSVADDAGVVIWDAALVLVHYLDELSRKTHGAFLRGKRVVDVGCGTGVVGLTAAALGAASVVLTDLPHLVTLTQRNAELNGLQGVAAAAPLCWGDPVGHLKPPFDLVLASDVVYQAEAIPALLCTLRQLSGPSTLVLLAIEHREALPFPAAQFEGAGFKVEQVPQQELHPDWRSDDIAVYRLALRSQGE